MKVVLTNLSNQLYEESRIRLNESAAKYGIANTNSYDFEDLKETPFYQKNKKILDQSKGIGYWLWKPYIILETMKDLSDGDIVVYSDCGIEFIDNIKPLIQICNDQEPILLFANGNFKNRKWTKRDCFILMDCDNEYFWNGQHCDAAFSVFKKSDITQLFLNQWLDYSSDERIVTDLPNQCGKANLSGFVEHRWDQSVLTLLALRYGVSFYRMPTQFGNHYKISSFRVKNEFNCINQLDQSEINFYAENTFTNSPYGQLLNHHRTKSSAKKTKNTQGFLSKIKRLIYSK